MIGYVYELVNRDSTIRYIGSTTKTPDARLNLHKMAYARYCEGGSSISIYPHFDIHGFDSFTMRILYGGIVEDTTQLRMKEQEFIDRLPCVNINRAYRTLDQKRAAKAAFALKYNAARLPVIAAKGRVRVLCSCGTEYNYSGATTHKRTAKHRTQLTNRLINHLHHINQTPYLINSVN